MTQVPDKITPVEKPDPKKKQTAFFLILTALFLFLMVLPSSLSGCSPAMNPNLPTPTITPVINPPRGLEMYTLTGSPACKINDLSVIRVLDEQGDLLAWSPVTDTLAYVGLSERSAWLSGPLKVVSPEESGDPRVLANHATGGLSWSPQGQRIAYVSMRSMDSLYTLNVVNLDGSGQQDLFPGETAKTDEWSGAKRVTGWPSEVTVELIASCGTSCALPIEVDLLAGTRRNISTPLRGKFDYWGVTRNIPENLPVVLRDLVQAAWTEDSSRVAYVDTRANLWVIDLENETQFRMDTGRSPRLAEPKWSMSGRYLAVRADTQLMIFDFECGRKP
jgi:hypothetical protein